MSGNNIDKTGKGYDLFKSYIRDLGIKDEDLNIKADFTSIFKEADADGNNVLEGDELKNLKSKTKEYFEGKVDYQLGEIENDYLEAMEALADFDNDGSSISSSDYNKALGDMISNSSDNYANNKEYTSNKSDTPSNNNYTPTTAPVSLTGNESLDELKAGRSEAISDLNAKKEEKKNAQDAISEQKDNVEEKKSAYETALNELDSDTVLEGQEKSLNDLKEDKEEKSNQIELQQGVIDGLNGSITDENANLEQIQSDLDGLEEPSESDYMEENEEGEMVLNEAEYNAAKERYENEKERLEEQKSASEKALASLNEQLKEAEDAMAVLENDEALIDEQISEVTEQILAAESDNTNAENLRNALDEYNTAKEELQNLEQESVAPIDAEISQIQDNLSAYNDAIDTKESEKAENNDSVSSKDEDGDGLPDYLKENEHIKLNDDGTYSIDIPKWKDSNKFSCPSSIMKQIYGLDWGTPEADKVYEALVKANEDNGTITGTPSNSMVYAGEAVLVDAEAILNGTADIDNPPLAKKIEKSDEEDTKNKDKAQDKVTLSDNEVDNIVDELLNGVEDEKTANEVWDDTNFSEYSSETIAQIAAKYEESGKDFIEKAGRIYNDDDDEESAQYDAIVNGLVSDAAENENTLQLLSDNIDKAIDNGNTRFINSLISSQENSLGELQKVISSYEDSKGVSLSEELPEYADEINDIKSKLYIADDILEKINTFDEAYENGDGLTECFDEIEDMDDEDLSKFVEAYNYVHKDDENENPFLSVAKDFYGTNEYDKITEAINLEVSDDIEITADTELSDGRTVNDLLSPLNGDLRDAGIDKLSAEDLALILNYENANIDVDVLVSEAKDAFGKTDYSELKERIDNINNNTEDVESTEDSEAVESAEGAETVEGEEGAETVEGGENSANNSENNIPDYVNNYIINPETDLVVVHDDGSFSISHEDSTYEEHSSIVTDSEGRITSETIYKNNRGQETISDKKYLYNQQGEIDFEETVQYKYDKAQNDMKGNKVEQTQIYTDADKISIYLTKYDESGIETSKVLTEKNKNGNVIGEYNITYSPNGGEIRTPINKNDGENISSDEESLTQDEQLRSQYAQLGLNDGQNDSFAEFAKLKNIDINTTPIEELQEYANQYQSLVNQKNEFLNLYHEFENDSNLKGYLDDVFELTDSDSTSGFTRQNLNSLYSFVNDIGAFKSQGEAGNAQTYDKDFEERVASAINEMKKIKYKNTGVNDSQGDSFTEYLKINNLNIDNLSAAELDEQFNEYNTLIEQKNQFVQLYELLYNSPEYSNYLKNSLNLTDTDYSSGVAVQSLENLYSYVNDVGAFRTNKESGDKNTYDKDFKERVPSAIAQMIRYIQDNKSANTEFIKAIEDITGYEI